jgi:plasmid maintenance system killer protein
MWQLVERRDAAKAIDKLPRKIAEKYAIWCAIVRQSGPQGLRWIKSFHDEKLSGKLSHLRSSLRSSRLSLQWRVIYRVDGDVVTVYVDDVNPHEYKP